jgi:hypothetical protein
MLWTADGLQRTRPADHVLDELSILQGSLDPLEVSYVRTRSCSDRSPPAPVTPPEQSGPNASPASPPSHAQGGPAGHAVKPVAQDGAR